ncbi:FAD binding domain-containing protein [Prauserella muralis]|uniref:Molybdopterin dehydrogenase n=1 Tax=Prauserella muralis TaxID=588067 RepID=A0A2V4AS80_9PSEU|nr:FAD binding domain-containing protein [Prauserella muralis]PXY22874.1 molybdopterin dehydrogenase [Prauserella muralis]TWE28635.1 carbon-monoxide dehydrogenase medium subunit [Prauserella muralis]
MKAAPFAYARPSTLDEAVAELASADGGGKVISGGQSLVPVLAMRLARPEVLVDINGIAELGRIERSDGAVEIGATVRQRAVERDRLSAEVPLLGMALPWVGHRELRSRGTVCGSLAHADPAAELPAVACCLDATVTLSGRTGPRQVAAREFYAGAMMTGLGPDEVLTSVRLPLARRADGYGFAEIARRHGDFALAGVAVHVRDNRVTVTGFGISDRPVTRTVTGEVTGDLLDAMVDTDGDGHASRDYRRRLFRVLAEREIGKARARAGRKERDDDQ